MTDTALIEKLWKAVRQLDDISTISSCAVQTAIEALEQEHIDAARKLFEQR